MTRKELKELKQWHLKAVQLHIRECLKKERGNTGNGGNYTTDRSNNGTDKDQTLTPKSFLETTTVYYNPSFVGYLIALARLVLNASLSVPFTALNKIYKEKYSVLNASLSVPFTAFTL